jgi:hypothetical protein
MTNPFKAIALIAITVLWSCVSVRAQVPSGNTNTASEALASLSRDPVFNAWKDNAEIINCGKCHYTPAVPFGYTTDFCQLTELRTWLENDKHAICRQRVEPMEIAQIEAITNELKKSMGSSKRDTEFIEDWVGASNYISLLMCRKLGYDVKTEAGYNKFRDNCLTCHGGYAIHTNSGQFNQGQSHPGISCNYCHQIGDNSAWAEEHNPPQLPKPKLWRTKTPAEKAAAGMRDLVDASQQVALCASCHMGDPASGKFVTHDMYVAGHPPLPGFDLKQFSTVMPRHWRDLRETAVALNDYADREKYFANNVPSAVAKQANGMPWDTRAILVNAISTAKQNALMIAGAENHWADYAMYDCSACHHELKLPSPRQNRKQIDAPGRPRLLEWTTPVLTAAFALADSDHAVEKATENLKRAISVTPFGAPELCIPEAKRLVDAFESLIKKMEAIPIGAPESKRMIKSLANSDADSLLDYHSARQVIWALQSIEAELRLMKQPLPEAGQKLIAELGSGENVPSVELKLPAGRTGNLFERTNASSSFIAKELLRIRTYDPMLFRLQLQKIDQSL